MQSFQQHFKLEKSPPGSGMVSAVSCWEFGLARRQQSAVALVDSVFLPDERADYSLFNYSNEFRKLVAEEYLR